MSDSSDDDAVEDAVEDVNVERRKTTPFSNSATIKRGTAAAVPLSVCANAVFPPPPPPPPVAFPPALGGFAVTAAVAGPDFESVEHEE